ncbi:MAG: iron-containing alcohol dehydrogenase [Kiloniellales bacterium]|nr:iron-containing alcohol dehydrogenase [Kiloniellales bacterium]
MSLQGNWNYPTALRFGAGRIAELPAACRELAIARPLIVTDPGLADLPMIADAVASCRAEGLEAGLFSDIKGNPTGANVSAGVAAFRDGAHDGVIAFGGGSGLDAGKAIAFMSGQNRPIWEFEDVGDNWTRADPAGIAPIVAVPTTAGTGSEVGRASVITDDEHHVKKIIFHPRILPQIVIADPALTLGLPAGLTAATGMDALSHNLEAFCAPGYHPMARGIAVEGMRLIHAWLARAVEDGGDLEARGHMLVASAMGATAFQRGLGAMHALSHPLGALYDAHHGTLNAVVMPYVLLANRAAIEEEITYAAGCLGLERAGFPAFLDWVLGLRARIGIAENLAELGIDDRQAELVGRMAIEDPSAGSNPVAFSAEQYAALFRRAVAGDLAPPN